MRAYFIAGLVSLSIAVGGETTALAQQPLWFTPQVLDSSPATGTTDASPRWWPDALPSTSLESQPAANQPKTPTLAQRYGDLFSKPGARLAIAMGNDQAAIVTASGESTSPQPMGIPWASPDPKRFSFAEVDSADAHSRGAGGTRGAQVRPMTPQVAPHLQAQSQSATSNSDAPMPTTVPWNDSTSAADTPAANWPLSEPVPGTRPMQRPSHFERLGQQDRQPLQARLASSARPLGSGNDEPSLVHPVPANKLEIPPKVQPSRVAMVQQRSPRGQPPETSDPDIDALEAPRSEPPAISRFTDKTNDVADTTNQPAERNHVSNGSGIPIRPIKELMPDETPLLNTDSMIGPLKGAEQLFNRLDLVEDLRTFGAPAAAGPREDAGQFGWMPTPYTWISPAFYHYPLYFEQPNLERYGVGRARAVQPLFSSAHFFWSIPLMPYKTLTHHPRERVYTLGQGRPGNCLPVQGGVILGPSTVGEVSMFWEQGSGY
ncbi:MAG: hypothetical protein KDA72_01455 [Planctomycetales bacterium]|nr:hypothetical protein [Planctomycetales bacterium]